MPPKNLMQATSRSGILFVIASTAAPIHRTPTDAADSSEERVTGAPGVMGVTGPGGSGSRGNPGDRRL